MITVKTNIPVVNANILRKLEILQNREYLLRPVCFDVIALMTTRIHRDGQKADGTQIGIYSSGYLRTRQKKFNRTADPKIIVSLTRQLENDWSVIATPKGYAVGFKNSFNRDKAKWVEERHGSIFKLSASEQEFATGRFKDLINDALNS